MLCGRWGSPKQGQQSGETAREGNGEPFPSSWWHVSLLRRVQGGGQANLLSHVEDGGFRSRCWRRGKQGLTLLLIPYQYPTSSSFFSFFLFLRNFSLGDNCFTMWCWFLPHNIMNQLYVYIYPLPPEPSFHPTPHPTPLGHHRAPNWAPCATSSFSLAIWFTHSIICVSVLLSQLIPPSASPTVSTSSFSKSASLFLSCK